MAKAKKVKQINFETRNKVGLLSTVTTALSSARINIKAICAYGMDKKAYFMLVTSNNAKARKILAKLKAKTTEDDVIAVEMSSGAGQLKKAAVKISNAGIDIQYMYGTVGKGKTSVCIFKTDNDRKALKVL
ncbi:MAG TPA: ACT domain-containing protein [Nitrospirae bacterium]|nr:ACT domain protein [bacterium BMS3Abin10]GBE38864.1 ACT domain protein [bacterium BMS3Bbin08]HDH50074.1 ACT domain-containing protein [Nitrospirota bacterium]HDK16713.1 ACT domain-containing protein [Nitrospirota bacterium]HDK81200.1 ACT domain-containing protein [Nitrospirota bacterium]